MSSSSDKNRCSRADEVCVYVVCALPAAEALDLELHIASCPNCGEQLAALRPVVESFSEWPTAILRPSSSLWDQLIARIGVEADGKVLSAAVVRRPEPDWEDVAPGISCKTLSSDSQNDRVTMLVRLAPGTDYPPHRHAGTEELHLLDGELWIDDRKLFPGDYNRALAGTSDRRVWSETGCTCLLITSPSDVLS